MNHGIIRKHYLHKLQWIFFSLTQICRVNFSMRPLNFLKSHCYISACVRDGSVHCGENFLKSLWRCFCFLFRRSYSDLCRNRELFLSSDCSQSCHFPDSDVPGQREDEDRAAHGSQRAREPHRLRKHWHLEWEDPQDPARDPVHPRLLHHPRALLLSCECEARGA